MLTINNSHIKSLSEYLSKYPIVFAYLFGSQAEGKSSSLSDIDVAVFMDKGVSRSERFDIRLRLTNDLSAKMGRRADVVVMNDIPVQLAYEVIKRGKVIFCKDRDAMVNSEVEILSKYLDRRYYDKRRAEFILAQTGQGI